jgi:intermembrane space import and assembly protein 40
MAHGPCGPEFREAFSCFVFSQEEPKGMECIDKFQNMQGCFQKHPDVYKGELEDDEELDAGLEEERQKLVGEIAERKAQQQQQSHDDTSHRLLEEPTSTPASVAGSTPTKSTNPPKPTKKPAQKSDKHNQEKPPVPSSGRPKSTSSNNQPQPEAKIETGSPFKEDQELDSETKSSPVRKPQPPPVDKSASASASPESDIIPQAAHDARDHVGVVEHEEDK